MTSATISGESADLAAADPTARGAAIGSADIRTLFGPSGSGSGSGGGSSGVHGSSADGVHGGGRCGGQPTLGDAFAAGSSSMAGGRGGDTKKDIRSFFRPPCAGGGAAAPHEMPSHEISSKRQRVGLQQNQPLR